MTHITCRLTAKNWNQLRNPTSMGYLYLLPFYTVVTNRYTDHATSVAIGRV